MSCENPIRLPNPRYSEYSTNKNKYEAQRFFEDKGYSFGPPDRYIDVPCGKCFSCERSRLNGYKLRLLSELARHTTSVFITLTFDDLSLARFKDNPNRAVRLFLDRFRKNIGYCPRHWFVAEFGDKNGRLHYHGILFGTPPDGFDYDVVTRLWKYGNIWLGYAREDTCSYIVKYITKNSVRGYKPPRIISSKGIGSNYVDMNGDFHRREKKPYLSVKGKYRVPLPRYITQKIYSLQETLQMQEDSRHLPFVRFVDGKTYTNEVSYRDALRRYSRKMRAIGLSRKVLKRKKSALADYASLLTKFIHDKTLSDEEYSQLYSSLPDNGFFSKKDFDFINDYCPF